MKRLLYVGHPHATPDKEDWFKALQNKYECMFFNYNGGQYVVPTGLDYIYIHAGSISTDTLLTIQGVNLKATTVQWTGDCRDDLMPDVLRLKGLVDITLLACGMGAQKEMYEKEVGRVEWFPHGVADWQFRKVNPDAKGIVFIGNNYGLFSGDIARAEICKKLKEVYKDDFKIYGNGWEDIAAGTVTVPFEQTPDIYNNACISIDGSIFNDKDGYFSNRPLCAMAAGSLTCVRSFPQVDGSFPLQWTWRDFVELKEKIDEALLRPDLRNLMASAQQTYVKANYHYDALVERFDKIISQ